MNKFRLGWLAPIAVFALLLLGSMTIVSAQSDPIWYTSNAFEQAGVIEVLTFDSVAGTSDADVIAALNQAGQVLYQQEGYVGRYFSGSDGNWVILNFWTTLDANNAANAVASADPGSAAAYQVINLDTLTLGQYAVQTAPRSLDLNRAGLIEVLTFDSVAGSDDASVIDALNQAGDVLYQQDGYVGRYFAGGAGKWLLVNFWESLEANNAANPVASTDPGSAAAYQVIDLNALTLGQYTIQTSPQSQRFTRAGVIEVLTFDSIDGMSDADVIAALNQAGDVLYQQEGYVGRYFSGSDGKWLIVNFWESLEANNAANPVASTDPGSAAAYQAIDLNALTLGQYTVQTAPR
jgi:hypothetical protein